MNSITNKDIKFIKRCFNLAKKGRGSVCPNPLVGAVIVKNNKIIGEGWHQKYGQAHAEVNALKDAKTSVAGATLYVNLEPCCHTNKNTPPCVPLIISNKIKRVVISNSDPNPEVSGKGIEQLRAARIEVNYGICEDEGSELNRFYFKYQKSGIPYITLKIAQSMDGKIGINNQEQTWLTGKASKQFVHRMRAEFDAVLVGANTVRVDDPQLTVREVKGRDPIRIMIDGSLNIPLNSAIFQKNETNTVIIFTNLNADPEKVALFQTKGAEVVKMAGNKKGTIDLQQVLEFLGKRKIMSLFVEGGQSIFSQFINKPIYDEIIILQAPVILGKGIDPVFLANREELFVKEINKIGNDVKIVLRKNI